MYKETYKLHDGRTLILRDIRKDDDPKKFLSYIHAMLDEGVYFLIDEKPTLKEEKEWLSELLKGISDRKKLMIVIEDTGEIVGGFHAERGRWKERHNVSLGFGLLKQYRNIGLGKYVINTLISRVQKEMRPKNIHLTVFAKNTAAIRLYERLGFRQIAVLPDWLIHEGKYMDQVMMIYDKK